VAQTVTYTSPSVAVNTASTDYNILAILAPATANVPVMSVQIMVSDTSTTNPPVTYSVHACTAISGGTSTTGVKMNRGLSLGIQTTAVYSPSSVTPSTGNEQDGSLLPVNSPFYQTYSGQFAILPGEYLVVRCNRNASTGNATVFARVKVLEAG
jgi:hypothetical protein